MFKKPFHSKSHTNLRNSDRRKVLACLPENVSKILSAEKKFSLQRIQTALKLSNIYIGEKCPLLFEIDGWDVIYPTVYSLWLCPLASYPVLFVYECVFEKLEGGADLMLPGVVNIIGSLPDIEMGDPVAITLLTDDGITGPVAVGRALMSSSAMIASGMKGKGVQILHCYRDHLWEAGDKSKPPTRTLEQIRASISPDPAVTEESNDKDENATTDANANMNSVQSVDEGIKNLELDPAESADVALEDDMEEMLRSTFLAAVRHKVDPKTCQFPIDAGQFYANYVLKNLPAGRRLDLKKTKYKKFSTFLRAINDECADNWLVRVVTSKKGVDSIEKLNFDHPAVQTAEFLAPSASSADDGQSNKPARIRVSECFSVTEAVMPFFRQFPKPIRKSDVLQPNRLRELVLDYAQTHGLIRGSGTDLMLDDTLQTVMKHFLPDVKAVNDVVQRIGSQMTKCFVVTNDADVPRQKIYRGSLPSIEMKVEKRSGNKVVTLVNNLAAFLIDERLLCQRIQSTQATGTSITPTAPNCDGPQVLAHGNVVNFVGEELMTAYGLQKKYIKGLEHGVKKKKKKK